MNKIINLRKKIVNVIFNSKAGHLNSSFSSLEIIFSALNFLKINNKFENFILSKGHAAVAYYVALNYFELLSDSDLDNFCKNESTLYGHPVRNIKNKISFTTGSLGNGLAAACGFAHAKKLKNSNEMIVCLVGDGECNEGMFWESLLLINKFNLSNLIIIIDDNSTSNSGSALPNLEKIINAFEFIEYQSVDGHNLYDLDNLFNRKYSRCQVIQARTQYGFGSLITLNNKIFHHPKLLEVDYLNIIESLKL
jgi:transketolase